MGPRTTALVLLVERFIKREASEHADEAVAWILEWQNEDGSFPAYVSARKGGIAMTATCIAGLVAGGLPRQDPRIVRAVEFIDRAGGFEAVDPAARLLLAMAGVLDVSAVAGNRAWPFAFPVIGFLIKRFNPGAIMFMMALGSVSAELKARAGGSRGVLWGPASNRMREFLLSLQGRNGALFDLPLATCWYMAALHGAGVGVEHPAMQRALAFLDSRKERSDGRMRVIGMDSEVWNSGLCLRALAAARVAGHDEVLRSGAADLIGLQILDPPTPEIFQPKPDAPERGGWAFTDQNEQQADTDDTGVALAGLESLRRLGLRDPAMDLAIDRGLEWMLGLQNKDGGWAAFAYGLPPKAPGPLDAELLLNPPTGLLDQMRLAMVPPREMGDPSTAGLTGRVLFTLGKLGFSWRDPEVARAIEFLKRQQIDGTGAWWGMWVVNYLPATACVLSGLASVGVPVAQGERWPWVQRALDFVLAHQNEDGGWGETPESYLDPSVAGVGPSMPALTGLILVSLCDMGMAASEAARRAAAYLLSKEDEGGGWTDKQWLQVVLFPDTLYANEAHPLCLPLEALSRYRDEVHGVPVRALFENTRPRGPELWTDEFFDQKRRTQDPVADAIVRQLFAEGGVAAVNEVLVTMTRNDMDLPANLPPLVRGFFGATDELPSFANDRATIQRGEEIFGRLAYPMITALFCASLPEAYAAARGARVLDQTDRLERDVDNRILETAQFLMDVMDQRGMTPDGNGILAAQKVRLIHASVRHLIHKSGRWDRDAWGQPINQEDLAGTLMTFSIVITEACRRLRFEIDPEDQLAYLYTWRAVGHLLGIDEDLIPESLVEARQLMTRIRERQHESSDHGAYLMVHLLRSMYSHLPFVPRAVPDVLVRELVGDVVADMLAVPHHRIANAAMDMFMDAADRLGWLHELPAGVPESSRHRARKVALFRMATVRSLIRAQRPGKKLRLRLPVALQED